MKPPAHTRAFFDPIKLRGLVLEAAVNAFDSKLNTIETPDFKLKAHSFSYDPTPISLADQKKAVFEKKDVTIPLKGTIDLVNKNTGDTVESKKITIAQLPYITERNTAIYNGSEYEGVNQMRLLPGMYSRIRQDGIPEVHINPAPRTGVAARILFLPDRQLFVLMVQNSQFNFYSLLHDMGVSDKDIKLAWGDAIFERNRAAYSSETIEKLYTKLMGPEPE